MGLTKALQLAKVKQKCGIPATNSTWDAEIEADIAEAVKLLYPRAKKEIEPAEDTLPSATRSLSLPTGSTDVYSIELEGETFTDYKVYAGKIWFDAESDDDLDLLIFPLGRYSVAEDGTIDNPDELDLVITYFAMSFFYDGLAGDRSRYSSYLSASGRPADMDAKDSAQTCFDRANELLDAQITE